MFVSFSTEFLSTILSTKWTSFSYFFLSFLLSKNKEKPLKSRNFNGLCSASRRTRTYNPSVNSRMLCHWAIEAKGGYYSTLFGIRRRPTLPGRVQPSTIGAEGLNFCVRYGNRWDPFAIATGNGIKFSRLAPWQPHMKKRGWWISLGPFSSQDFEIKPSTD